MTDTIYCTYQGSLNAILESKEHRDKIKVLQIFAEGGKVIIGKTTFPITYGGLYFIGANTKYMIIPTDSLSCNQNACMVSETLMNQVAEVLDFTQVQFDIFKAQQGLYVPMKNPKAVDSKFKEMQDIVSKNNDYTKALLVAKIMDIYKYAVMTNLHKKNK